MWTRDTSGELDMWAEALGAHNDADAIAELRNLQLRLMGAADELQICLDLMPESARRAKWTDGARSWVATAIQNTEEAWDYIALIRSAFVRHERGES